MSPVAGDGSLAVVGRYVGKLEVGPLSLEAEQPRTYALKLDADGTVAWLNDAGPCLRSCGRVAIEEEDGEVYVAVDRKEVVEHVVFRRDGQEARRALQTYHRAFGLMFCANVLSYAGSVIEDGVEQWVLKIHGGTIIEEPGRGEPMIACTQDGRPITARMRGEMLHVGVNPLVGGHSAENAIALSDRDQLTGVVVDGSGTLRVATRRGDDDMISVFSDGLHFDETFARNKPLLAVGSGDGQWYDVRMRDAITVRALSGDDTVFEQALPGIDDVSALRERRRGDMILVGQADGTPFVAALEP